jgi:alkylhydroperoxidase family enzyme
VGELPRYIAQCRWLREATLLLDLYKPQYLSMRLFHIGAMVTSQENSCRYCYGANRAFLKMLGYRESLIDRIERDVQLAELDARERAFIQFARNLARSSPRPARAEREALLRLGYPPREVAEMAFLIAVGCFYNRVATLLACPPEANFERFVASPMGRLMGLAGPLLRPLLQHKRPMAALPAGADIEASPFASLLATLEGLPAAGVLHTILQSAFAPTALPRRTKALMFAVVARSLECRYCEMKSRSLLIGEGLSEPEVETSINTLASPRLEPYEASLLNWVRSTVHYEPATVQAQTRALAQEIGIERTLEAVGVASLANAMARLAMLLA